MVKVAGEVKGLSEFTLVKITNLIAQTWEVGDNHGVSFRAERVEVVKAAAKAVSSRRPLLRISLGRAFAHELLDFADVEFLEDCGTPQRAVKALSRQGQEEVAGAR